MMHEPKTFLESRTKIYNIILFTLFDRTQLSKVINRAAFIWCMMSDTYK